MTRMTCTFSGYRYCLDCRELNAASGASVTRRKSISLKTEVSGRPVTTHIARHAIESAWCPDKCAEAMSTFVRCIRGNLTYYSYRRATFTLRYGFITSFLKTKRWRAPPGGTSQDSDQGLSLEHRPACRPHQDSKGSILELGWLQVHVVSNDKRFFE